MVEGRLIAPRTRRGSLPAQPAGRSDKSTEVAMPTGGKSGRSEGKAGKGGKSTGGADGPAREVGKGELETGRRDASAAGAGEAAADRVSTRVASKAPPAPQLPDEKAVRETDRTVPVAPAPKESPEERSPIPLPAVDQRRQIVGTDEP